MTREEGLDWLYRLRSEIYVHMPKEWLIPMHNALDMAIKVLEHPEKNVIAVVPCGDAISRSDVLKLMQDNWHTHNGDWAMQESMDDIRALPSVTPQESFINKPCVSEKVCEHDKNVVLDKIRDQLKSHLRGVEITLEVLVENDPLRPKMEGAKCTLEDCLELIDKAETEDT